MLLKIQNQKVAEHNVNFETVVIEDAPLEPILVPTLQRSLQLKKLEI
jgi:hypothetical protein